METIHLVLVIHACGEIVEISKQGRARHFATLSGQTMETVHVFDNKNGSLET